MQQQKKIKRLLIKLNWILSTQFGFDVRVLLRSIRGMPSYFRDYLIFRSQFNGNISFMPCLSDRYEEGGATKTEYFWQDLFVARAVYEANPQRHVDIGSRVDGFVSHVASYRECEVIDVRPISTVIPGVLFRRADLMDPSSLLTSNSEGYCDSLSCLHAIEHFGLGRYGDPINPLGYQQGIANMARLLKLGGLFYLSTPVGRERVEFNANWVFDPRSIISIAEASGLFLAKLFIITPEKGVQERGVDINSLVDLSEVNYQLCLFIFKKITFIDENRKTN